VLKATARLMRGEEGVVGWEDNAAVKIKKREPLE